jgi:hypothetical protein
MSALRSRTATLINKILESLGPRYEIRFVQIDSDNAKVLVDIGPHRVVARVTSGEERIWFGRSVPAISEAEVQFLSHLNATLAGEKGRLDEQT